jgi:uncharacterized membrane protein
MSVTLAIGATLFLGAFYSWTSRINGMFFFGRSADAELKASREGRAITRQYLAWIIATTAAASLLAWFTARFGRNFAAIGPLMEAVGFWAIFATANRRVRALELSQGSTTPQDSIVQVPLLETPPYTVPTLSIALLPALLAVLTVAAALALAAHGTAEHASLGGAWTAWNADLEAHHLDALFGLSLGLLTSATAMLLLFRSSVRLRTNMAQYTIRASVIMEWIGLTILLVVVACNYFGFSVAHHTSKVFILIALAAAFATLVWNQARSKRFVPPPVEMGADERWRWGLFYVDRRDPALFVQSRCGAGYTLNYGRMLAWPISFAVIAYFVVLLFMPLHP